MTSSSENRGSLRDAMEKAKDENEGDREVPPPTQDEEESENDEWYSNDDEYENQEEEEETPIVFDPDLTDLVFSVRGGTNFYSNPYFNSYVDGELLLGFSSDKEYLNFYLFGGAKIHLPKPEHPISLSIKEVSAQFNIGIEARFYPLPHWKIFSPYLLARGGGFIYFWTYKNPIISNGDTIYSDSLGGLLLGVGFGTDFFKNETFFIGAQIIPELYIFSEQTSQGFTNDYFGSYGTIRVTIEVGFYL